MAYVEKLRLGLECKEALYSFKDDDPCIKSKEPVCVQGGT